jgi:hypothetical protein
LPTDDVIAIPIPCSSRSAHFAVIAASHIARPPAEQRQVAALLAHLAADAVELEIGASKVTQPAAGTAEDKSAPS